MIRLNIKSLLVILTTLISFKTVAQQVADPFQIGFKLIDSGNYLGARDTVLKMKQNFYKENHLIEGISTPTLVDQSLALFESFIGETLDLNWKKSKLRAKKGEQVNFTPAIPYIINYCANKQVVMINEDHNTPKHRILTYNLLDTFYKMGFRYLAVEALESDLSYKKFGFPQINSGMYTAEPNMGNLMKKAIKLGFKLIPYESKDRTEYTGDSESYLDNIREVNQAKNLNDILLKDPKAKILVHAGHGHIWEKGGNIIFMAEYFRIISGVDPVTINQAINSMYEFKEKLDLTINLKHTDVPYIVLDKDKNPRVSGGDAKGAYDMLVTWPTPQEKYGRKDYLLSKEGTKFSIIKVTKGDEGKLVQIMALNPNDNIPLDQFIVKHKIYKYGVALQAGEYNVQVVDNNGHIISKHKISIL